jgi:hypothetical protein
MADRLQRGLGIAAVAIVVMGFVGWRAVGSTPPLRGVGSPPPVPNPQLAQLLPYAAPVPDSLGSSLPVPENVALPRDPFVGREPVAAARPAGNGAAPVVQHSEGPKWEVTATLTSGARRAAVINDALIYVGDTLPGGSRLTSVERDRVVLTDAKGTPHTVAVKEDNG